MDEGALGSIDDLFRLWRGLPPPSLTCCFLEMYLIASLLLSDRRTESTNVAATQSLRILKLRIREDSERLIGPGH